MSIYLAVPLVIVGIVASFALLIAYIATPPEVFVIPGMLLMVVAGVAAGASELAYGDVAAWVDYALYGGLGLMVLALPGMAAGA